MIIFISVSLLLAAMAAVFVVPSLWQASAVSGKATAPQRREAIGLVIALVALTALLYVVVGTPQAIDQQGLAAGRSEVSDAPEVQASSPQGSPEMSPAQIEAMVNRLAQRLQTQPKDPQGWRMLARSYETLGRFSEAVDAYQRLMALQKPDADLLTDYAVALGMSQNRTLVGAPEIVLEQALALTPTHIQALALSGSAALERADYGRAVSQWRKILVIVPEGDETRSAIERNIDRAEALQRGEKL